MPIIDAPTAFCIKEFSLQISDTLSQTRGVYSLRENVLDFGASIWRLDVQLHNFNGEEAGELLSYLDRLREADDVGRFSLPAKTPTKFGTTVATQLTITADVSARSRNIPVSGVGAATLRWGSMVQIGDHIYRIRTNLSADAGTLVIEPRLREDVLTGAIMEIEDPKGVWRLQGRPVENHLGRWTTGLSASFVEALNFS